MQITGKLIPVDKLIITENGLTLNDAATEEEKKIFNSAMGTVDKYPKTQSATRSINKGLFIDIQKSKNIPPGGIWKTVKGAKVYIKDGKIIAGANGKIVAGAKNLTKEKTTSNKTSKTTPKTASTAKVATRQVKNTGNREKEPVSTTKTTTKPKNTKPNIKVTVQNSDNAVRNNEYTFRVLKKALQNEYIQQAYAKWGKNGKVNFANFMNEDFTGKGETMVKMGLDNVAHLLTRHIPDTQVEEWLKNSNLFDEYEKKISDYASDQNVPEIQAKRQMLNHYREKVMGEQVYNDFKNRFSKHGYFGGVETLEIDGEPVGLVNYSFDSLINATVVNFLEIDPAHAGKGYGSVLLAKIAEKTLKETEDAGLFLISTQPARKFYLKIGMKEGRTREYSTGDETDFVFDREQTKNFVETVKNSNLSKSVQTKAFSFVEAEEQFGCLTGSTRMVELKKNKPIEWEIENYVNSIK